MASVSVAIVSRANVPKASVFIVIVLVVSIPVELFQKLVFL